MNEFDPDVYVQVTVGPDGVHPGGKAAAAVAANTPNPATMVIPDIRLLPTVARI